MKDKIKVVIPARYGSRRLPGKPLLLLNGKPMFWHVVQRVIEAGIDVGDIVVATDDERIVRSAESECIPVQMTSSKHVSGTDRVNEVSCKNNWSDDLIVFNVQGDEPLIPPELIAALVKFTLNNKNFSITTAVTPIQAASDLSNPNIVKAILSENNTALYFTRSPSPFNRDNPQDFSLAFRHIGIYGYRVSTLRRFCSYKESRLESYEKLEQLRALSYGMSVGATITKAPLPHGIDTIDDYKIVKKLMANK